MTCFDLEQGRLWKEIPNEKDRMPRILVHFSEISPCVDQVHEVQVRLFSPGHQDETIH